MRLGSLADNAITGFASVQGLSTELNRMSFVVRQILNGTATATLVQVKAVDGEMVDVQPMVSQIDGAGKVYAHDVIHGVPWFALRSGTTAIVVTPQVGDIGLAVFCHNDTSVVRKTKKLGPPGSRRRYSWADALYLGGFLGATPTQYIRLDADGIAVQAASGKPVTITSSDKIHAVGPVDASVEYRVAGTKVVGAQQGAITAPTGGSTIDTQSRTSIAAIITALQTHGLIA